MRAYESALLLLATATAVSAAPAPSLLSSLLSSVNGILSPSTSTSSGGKATCVSGLVAVTASASNTKLLLTNPQDQYSSTEIFVEYLQPTSGIASAVNGGKTVVSGTYNIHTKLCFPVGSTVSNFPTVQFLIHGINFDKLYWDIPGYSYVDAAASAGYATFSYDRLGTGSSDHPDPLQVVQAPLQVEIAHKLIEGLRSGAIGGNAFKNVVGVGHSFGSIQSIGLAAQYPEDLDAIILQGFTLNTANLPATIAAFNPTIASKSSSSRFGNLASGYNVINSPVSDQTAFYRYPNFDTSLFNNLDGKKQTFTLGEIFTLTSPVVPATQFKGPVHVVNGQNDFIFCQSDCNYPTDQGALVVPALFPAASSGSANFIAPGVGHAINAHSAAPQVFKQMLDFVKANGF